MQSAAEKGCNFLSAGNRCELHATPYLPLECAFSHHRARRARANSATPIWKKIGRPPWASPLVKRWCRQLGWWDLLEGLGLGWLRK